MHIRKFHSETGQICEHFSEGLQFFSQTVLSPVFHIFLCMLGVTRGKFLQKMAVLRFTIGPTEPPFRNQILSISGRRVCLFEYVCCCFSSKSLRARNRGRVRVEKLIQRISLYLFHSHPRRLQIPRLQTLLGKAALNIGHTSTGPRTIFPTRRLGVDFRDRTYLTITIFMFTVCVVTYSTAVPGENWRRAIARHPSTNRKGADQMPYGSFRGLSDEHMRAGCWGPAANYLAEWASMGFLRPKDQMKMSGKLAPAS